MEILLLFLAGLIGGALNTLAGGGSFITFPALVLAGVLPVTANATNTFAALPGYISGAIGFWPELKRHRERLLGYAIMAGIGGWVGAELLLIQSDAGFGRIVPWLMAFAVLLFVFGARINVFFAGRSLGGGNITPLLSALLLFVVSVYGGFFNAGFGILLLAIFALSGMIDLNVMNGLKLWISAVVALVAILRFGLGDAISWTQGGVVFVGTTIGGYGAARLARRMPMRLLRLFVTVLGLLVTLGFFVNTYGMGLIQTALS